MCRASDKRFYQERYIGDGNYERGIQGVTRTLYNRPALREATDNHKVVWVCEGEKDADAITARGLPSTTNPGGAGKWREEYSRLLVGVRRVNLVWDVDEAGQKHAVEVEASLRKLGIQVRMLRAKEGKDAYDHFTNGYSTDKFVMERPASEYAPSTNGTGPTHASPESGSEQLPAVYQLALTRLREHAEQHNLKAPYQTDRGWEACCPAHDDKRPSLGIRVGNDHPLVVDCQAGCEPEAIAEALGIDFREFSDHKASDLDLEKEIHRQRIRKQASIFISNEAAPEVDVPTVTPLEYMTLQPPEHPYSIDELHITGANTLIVAAYKAGKSTLAINLFRSLVNKEPFLSKFAVGEQVGRVAYMDYEMQESQFRTWLQAGGPLDYDRMVTPWHLRGQSLPLGSEKVRKEVVAWLHDNSVSALIVDTAARAWSGLVENENSNSEILLFTDALDSIKAEAGVQDLFLITHTGRNQFVQEGEERARGATRLEDWMDIGWYLTKDNKGTRYMRAMGRGVDMDAFALKYEAMSHTLMTTGVSKQEHQNMAALEAVVDVISAFDGPPTMSEIKDMLKNGDNTTKHRWILEAETRGYITRTQGKGRSIKCDLTEQGRKLHRRAIRVAKD